jgi:hypothetical protein
MGISESQLVTWSEVGAITTSCQSYNIVKNALEAKTTPYNQYEFKVFLQGSYGNLTNVWKDSDVDIVIRLESTFHYDLSLLSPAQDQLVRQQMPPAQYRWENFRQDVLSVLKGQFGQSVSLGNKAIKVPAGGGRRDADVVPTLLCRRYENRSILGGLGDTWTEGIWFLDKAGRSVINFPKQHRANMEAKNALTRYRFKQTVRILKNLRNRLVDDGKLAEGTAPSYYIEGLLYNVPDGLFVDIYFEKSVFKVLQHLMGITDFSGFVCANRQFYLFQTNPPMWSVDACKTFLGAVANAWDKWQR